MPRAPAAASLNASLGTGSTAALGAAPSVAMGMTYVAMADSLGLAMGNAVANQQRGQVIANAALTKVLEMIIAQGGASS